VPQTSAYGEAFEHWVILEILKNINYLRLDWQLSYLCTKDDLEIDLIIDRPGMKTLLIEIKSKTNVSESDVKSLELLGDDIDRKAERWLLSNDLNSKKFGKTEAVHWLKAIHTWFKI
jgi:predicted AAA+ superfamily ATPase